MTTPNVVRSGAGVRNFQIFALDSNGYPAATSTAAYEGVNVSGIRSLTITDPAPRVVTHFGDDRVIALDVLPPTEALSGEMVVSKINDTVDAAVQGGPKSFTVGQFKLYPARTDKSGNESQVGVLVYQQAVDSDRDSASNYGKRYWNSNILPKAWLFPRQPGFDENPTAVTYTLQPQIVMKHLWGTDFSTTTEGVDDAQAIRGVSIDKPHLCAFKADGATTSFTLTTPAVSVASMKVWDNGSDAADSVTLTTSAIAFTTGGAPTADHIIVSLYEVS